MQTTAQMLRYKLYLLNMTTFILKPDSGQVNWQTQTSEYEDGKSSLSNIDYRCEDRKNGELRGNTGAIR